MVPLMITLGIRLNPRIIMWLEKSKKENGIILYIASQMWQDKGGCYEAVSSKAKLGLVKWTTGKFVVMMQIFQQCCVADDMGRKVNQLAILLHSNVSKIRQVNIANHEIFHKSASEKQFKIQNVQTGASLLSVCSIYYTVQTINNGVLLCPAILCSMHHNIHTACSIH